MEARPIVFGSAEFELACRLRDSVLRIPLGLSLFDEDLDSERDQLHFGLFDGSAQLVAVVVAVVESPSSARLRQMAVDPGYARQGNGARLLRWVEANLKDRGFEHIELHARTTALRFYQQHGYLVQGPDFVEVGIPHVIMEKWL